MSCSLLFLLCCDLRNTRFPFQFSYTASGLKSTKNNYFRNSLKSYLVCFPIFKNFLKSWEHIPWITIHQRRNSLYYMKCLCACMLAKSLQSCPTLCNPKDYSPPPPLSVGFFSLKYWSGLPSPPPGSLPYARIEPGPFCLLHWQMSSLAQMPPGKPAFVQWPVNIFCKKKNIKLSAQSPICTSKNFHFP